MLWLLLIKGTKVKRPTVQRKLVIKNLWQPHETTYRPAVGVGATRVPSYEWGGLAHAAGWGHHAFLCVSAWHWTGPGGDQETFGVVLTPTAAKVVAAGVTEAPSFEPAHQALGNHLIKTLPVLLGNEDPGEHCGIKHSLRLTRKTKSKQRRRGKLRAWFRLSLLLFYVREISHTMKRFTERNCIKAAFQPKSIILIQTIHCPKYPKPSPPKIEGFLVWLRIVPTPGST